MKNNFIHVLFSKHTENYGNSSLALFCLKKKNMKLAILPLCIKFLILIVKQNLFCLQI